MLRASLSAMSPALPRPTHLAATLCLMALVGPLPAHALDGQLLGGARLGGAYASGPAGGLGGQLELHGAYGLNDAFSVYATTGYQALGGAAAEGVRHGFHVSAGLAYAFDYLRVTPVISLGARGNLTLAPQADWLAPAAEARLGLVWNLQRFRHLELDLSYAAAFARRDLSGDVVQLTVGVRFLRDL